MATASITVDLLYSAHDAVAPPEWVHLIPAGTFFGRDGRGPYVFDDDAARAVLAAFAVHGADLPVDYDHQSLSADDKAGPVPAAGWIKELQARDDGLWARVEWTPKAAAMLADKEYRYLSPVFRYSIKDGRIAALSGAGLTHNPNLYLQAAASRQKGDDMKDLIESVCHALNLPDINTVDELVTELQNRLKTADPDPAQYVPMEMYTSVKDKLAAIEAAQAEAAAQAAVQAAMSAGKLAPAMQEWALSYARRDPAGFEAFAAAAPKIVSQSASAPPPTAVKAHGWRVPDGYQVDEEAMALHARAIAHQQANPGMDYLSAVRHVSTH